METEQTLKEGDVCVDCQQLGLEKHLRYFKLNLNGDKLLKCESNECMYPYNDDIYSSSDEEQEVKQNLVETNSLKFIDDFLQQYAKENENENTTNDFITNPNESTTSQFDMSFLDNLQEINNENLSNQGFGIENVENPLIELTNSNETLKQTEFSIENVEILKNKAEEKIIDNQLSVLTNPKETLKPIEFTMENIEILNNKNNEFLSLDSLNSPKCEITTAVVQECSNNDGDKGTISYITIINDPPTVYKTNETEMNELKSNLQNDKQISFSTFMEDNVKDCKPKIDIQSIETIKIESSLCNLLPTISDIKITTTEISSNNSNSNNSHTSLKTSKKTTRKYQTKTKAPKKISQSKLSSSTSNEPVSETINTSNSNSLTSNIPKANILKGSDLLKKLALADEKSSKLNTKLKASRNNKKFAQKQPQEPTAPPSTSLPKSDTDFSLDKLSEILIANKLKRESKNE